MTKAEGSRVDVQLHSQFAVLGTETDTETGNNDDGPGGHADEAASSSSTSGQ